MAKQAFVIPRAELVDSGLIPASTEGKATYVGLTKEMLNKLFELAAKPTIGTFRERGGPNDVEKDPTVQQIIIYGFVVLPDGRFMVYQRGTEGYDESRLAGKVSMGLGGHMEPTDLSLMGAFYRELDEETVITANGQALNFRREDGTTDVERMQQYVHVEPVGLIKDERDDVGIYHLGVACRLTPAQDDVQIGVRPESGENVRSSFVTPAEYTQQVQSGDIIPEGWTDMVFDNEIAQAA